MSKQTTMRDRLLAQDGIAEHVPDTQMEPIRAFIRRSKLQRKMIAATAIGCWLAGFTLLFASKIVFKMAAASEEMGNLSFKHETSFGPEIYEVYLWSGLAVLIVGIILSLPIYFKARARRKAITRLGTGLSNPR